ncbi:MFS transporter [Nocardia sp. NPDC087230]|uniref:MFS transporter n=1 Tax=Nocardia sp. NPDC087230 TaxID=3364331 RepID=UPI003822B481
MPRWLVALFAASFVFYTDDYVIAGVLPEIARDLGVRQAAAGQLVTVFAVTVAIVAPVAGVLLARVARRALLVTCLGVFVAANLGALLTPSFGVLMGWRIVAAAAAAAATPSLFATAFQRAPDGKAGRYLAVVTLGVTGSIAVGVPIGTWIGGAYGWRASFAAMAVGGALALGGLLATLPRQRPDGVLPDWRAQLRSLGRRPVAVGLLANVSLITGSMMMLTYLAPFLTEVTGSGVDARAVSFGLAGVAGMAGMWGGGVATDRWGPRRALAAGITAIAVSMGYLGVTWVVRPVPIAALLPVLAVWGAAAFWNAPAIQARLASLTGPLAPQALALNTSGTYLGVSLGGLVGGVALGTWGAAALPPIAAGFALAALAVLAAARSQRWAPRPRRARR